MLYLYINVLKAFCEQVHTSMSCYLCNGSDPTDNTDEGTSRFSHLDVLSPFDSRTTLTLSLSKSCWSGHTNSQPQQRQLRQLRQRRQLRAASVALASSRKEGRKNGRAKFAIMLSFLLI